MAATTRRTRGSGSRLFLWYAAASLLPVLVLGGVLLQSEQRDGLERGLAQGRAQAAVIEQMALSPALEDHDLDEGVSAAERTRLQGATDLAIFDGSVSRLRLRGFSGRVVFSDDGLNSSPVPSSGAAFRAAADGEPQVAVVADEAGVAGQRSIRVLQPVRPAASGRTVGVLEVTLPYAPIEQLVDRQLHHTTLLLALGLGGLYVVLGIISWSTTTRLRRHAASQEHEALHDGLTGLPNRGFFRECAEAALRSAGRTTCTAVVLVDLDRFKQVNDTLGHHAGDQLLQTVARRLREALRTDDTVARLGGDEFGLVLPDVGDRDEAVALLDRVRASLAEEVEIEGVVLAVEASFGVALSPEHGTDVETLLRHADAAMYTSKRGTEGVVVHAEPARPGPADLRGAPTALTALTLQRELRQALERDELRLHYQPKVALRTGAVLGLEALLRWQHPVRGLLAPGAFLAAAEQSDLIEPLTAWVLHRALSDRAQWAAEGAPWTVSVNVSARSLSSPALAGHVAASLAATGTPAPALCLEVTETAIAVDAEAAVRTLDGLAQLGTTISIDDFGAGYTSLGQLRTFPVGEVKIDRAFVMQLTERSSDRAIVRAVIELGHGLGCAVTAEGVEDAATAAWLRRAGCDSAQGYHFARPAPWRALALPVPAAPTALPLPLPLLPVQDVPSR